MTTTPPPFPSAPAPPPPPPPPPAYPGAPAGGYPPPQVQFPPPGNFDTPSGVPYAAWGTRLGGWLIDAVILAVPIIVLSIAFRHTHVLQLHTMMARQHGVHRRTTISGLALLIGALIALSYATILYGGPRGQTVGMMAVGVRVVRDGSLEPLGYGRALGRAVAEQVFRATILLLILGVVWLLDMLWPLWDKKRQTLHDKIAGTVVLTTQPKG
jgi:uncharacterized RDD family membrane protein YckC